jgi:hypothetical protein
VASLRFGHSVAIPRAVLRWCKRGAREIRGVWESFGKGGGWDGSSIVYYYADWGSDARCQGRRVHPV